MSEKGHEKKLTVAGGRRDDEEREVAEAIRRTADQRDPESRDGKRRGKQS